MIFIIFSVIAILYGIFYFEFNRNIYVSGTISISMKILLGIFLLVGLIGVLNIVF